MTPPPARSLRHLPTASAVRYAIGVPRPPPQTAAAPRHASSSADQPAQPPPPPLHPPQPRPHLAPNLDDGDTRNLPKTPADKPWRAVYVQPSHLGGTGSPRIHYGHLLESHSSSNGASSSSSSRSKPIDSEKLLRISKFSRIKAKPKSASRSALASSESESASELQAMGGGTRGWASVVEERIRRAQESGFFKVNKLHGQPLQRDLQQRNPFLSSEEFFMNRIVQRQGAAPPWVLLNAEFQDELELFRARLCERWCRRVVRMVMSGSARRGLEPLPLPQRATPPMQQETQQAAADDDAAAFATPGQQRTVDIALRYRDPEWLQAQRPYHTHEVQRLNDLVRRHNHLAPFHARKGLVSLDSELDHLYQRAPPLLAQSLSDAIRDQDRGAAAVAAPGHEGRAERTATRDVWGRMVTAAGSVEPVESKAGGWWGNSVADGGADRARAKAAAEGAPHDRQDRKDRMAPSLATQELGLVAALRRTLGWARQRLGG
ncbi:hypothetical protein ACQY0O_002415 [Thecaphora frezii]